MQEAVSIPEVGATVLGRVVRFFEHSALLEIRIGICPNLNRWLATGPAVETSLNAVCSAPAAHPRAFGGKVDNELSARRHRRKGVG
jgi:hypothetical protein